MRIGKRGWRISRVDGPLSTLVSGARHFARVTPHDDLLSEAGGEPGVKPSNFQGFARIENDMAKTKKTAVTRASMKPPPAKAAPAKAGGGKEETGPLKRKLGLRGAAPWAARHAAKHAAEARARAAEPPLPGSARATIRTPVDAEDIKQKIRELHAALAQVKALRKNLSKTFFDIGVVLRDIQTRKLYEAKRFPSFEAFVEREIDLGKTTAMRLVRVATLFQKEGALELGMDRAFGAIAAIDSVGDTEVARIPPAPVSATALPLRPPGR